MFESGLKPALLTLAAFATSLAFAAPVSPQAKAFIEKYCAGCHNDVDKESNLDLTSLPFAPKERTNYLTWVKVHDRLRAGEMPPKEKKRPDAAELATFVGDVSSAITKYEADTASEGRATRRRLNGYEYENALRDLFSAPWLQVKGQFPDDGEAFRYNKLADALDVSHVHMARYMTAADYAIRQVISQQFVRPPTKTERYYARDQRTLTSKFDSRVNTSPDRMTYPVLDLTTAQPDVRWRRVPLTDPKMRDREAIGWVASNYVTGFVYRWDGFRAPVAGRYRVRFNGYTLWCAPNGIQMSYAGERDKVGKPRPPNAALPDYDKLLPGRRNEPITVYTRNGVLNRRVGEFDLTPEPSAHDVGEVWLLANETLVPDPSRFYRSRPTAFKNPLMTPEGAPSVAFRWMEVEGPLYDEATGAGYRLLFGDLPLRKAKKGPGVAINTIAPGDRREDGRNATQRTVPMEETTVAVVSDNPARDAERLLRGFLAQAYRRPVEERDVQRFLGLITERMKAGLSFTEAMVAGYTAVLASPGFVFVDEKPGRLDDYALATRLALFLWNSEPDAKLRERAAGGELHRPEVLKAETERMLADARSQRFVEAFLDYWIDVRKLEDTTPSTTLYNDYYLDDALTEAALAETQLFFTEMLRRDLPARTIIDSDFTFLNDRLATHYGIPGVEGIAMRRVKLPAGSPRGGLLTQATVLKVTANGTTTSPVLRGKWITERILGLEIPPPPASVTAVEPDIRGAVTIREQLDKHRADPSCASCHRTMDPPGFALESFDVMGGWRDQYRGISPDKPAIAGRGKNGQPFEFHFGLPVDCAGELPDGRAFKDIRDFKRLLLEREEQIARNLAQQLAIYATAAPVRFTDRPEIEKILSQARPGGYGLRSLVQAIVQSELFLNK